MGYWWPPLQSNCVLLFQSRIQRLCSMANPADGAVCAGSQAPWKRCTCSPLVFEKRWVGYLPCGRAPAPPYSAACCSLSVPGLAVASHHGVVIAVHASQDGVVEGGRWAVRAFGGTVGALTALAAEDLLERRAHFLVPVRVDDGVHGRVELCQEQEEFFIGQDIALGTTNIEEQQD